MNNKLLSPEKESNHFSDHHLYEMVRGLAVIPRKSGKSVCDREGGVIGGSLLEARWTEYPSAIADVTDLSI